MKNATIKDLYHANKVVTKAKMDSNNNNNNKITLMDEVYTSIPALCLVIILKIIIIMHKVKVQVWLS